MTFGKTTPILRMFDEAKAREFYVDFLGFTVDWEHRFEPDTPLYMQISKDQCVLHLSEHYGDGNPGAELMAKHYKYARPGIEDQPWGTRELSVKDPFGNRLTFTNAISN
jgi:uncharacterized glyoxalase superfamily protein PhnB